jgi:hypothetical protein
VAPSPHSPEQAPEGQQQPAPLRSGDLVAGRYRLDEPVHSAARPAVPEDGPGSSPAVLWRATDEVLARTVAVKVLCTGAPCEPGADPDPQAGQPFLQAAASAGRLTGTVLARVYDAAAEDWPGDAGRPAGRLAYVISEWVDGRDLTTVLREDGPLDPVSACRLTATVAEALQSAHDRGVVHGRLHPGNVLLLPDGRVKVTDTATSAALPDRGVPAQRTGDPHGPAADVRDLTAVLYALLTARWPAGATPQPSCGLPPAPSAPDGRRRGRLVSPRQVRAGVPTGLDDLVQRVLQPAPGTAGPRSAAELADALDGALPVDRQPRRSGRPARGRRRRTRRAVAVVGGALVVALLAGGGWTLGGGDVLAAVGLDDLLSRDEPSTIAAPSAAPAPPVPVPLAAGAVTDFDPPPGSGTESTEQVPNAVDGDEATVWRTERYRSAAFGGLKEGVGLLVDLGAPTPVSSVELSTLPGTSVEVRAADARGATAAEYRVLAQGTAAGPGLVLAPPAGSTARWVLVWITALPAVDGGFAAQVGELRLLR